MIQSRQGKQEMAKMVRLEDDVHADLTSIGAKNESYSDIVKRLIEFWKKEHGRS